MHNFGKNLSTVKWADGINDLNIAVNSSNYPDIDETTINQIIQNSIAQWNGKSRINLLTSATIGTNQNGLNEIYFSDDPSIFNGPGVASVTLITFKENTSEILESDIVINSSIQFNSVSMSTLYLGNVLTHELGHLVGLSHSQVHSSSMFYQLSLGQHQLENDDKAGIYSLYPKANLNKTSLSGKIVGGKSLISVFGAHVEAISESTGKVMASSFSDFDGTFKIDGLNKNENYFLYTSPMSKTGANFKYQRARFDFCGGSKNFRGSFFQSCEKKYQGYPQIINVNEQQNIDLGNITIRCDIDSPTDYITSKINQTPFMLPMENSQGIGNSFVGFFTSAEVKAETKEEIFKVDLSAQDFSGSAGDLYLEVKVTNQALYSPFIAKLAYERIDGMIQDYDDEDFEITADGSFNSDQTVRIPIDQNNQLNNIFTFKIKPAQAMTSAFNNINVIDERLFPSAASYADSNFFYLVNASIVRNLAPANVYSKYNSKILTFTDNSSCTDANNTYALSATYLTSTSDEEARKIEKATSCGSIDTDNTGSGPGGFFAGLVLSLLIAQLFSRFNSHKALKHVGNLA